MDRDRAAEVLGVAGGASRAEVRSAFRERARAAHPDAGGRLDADIDTLRRARDLLTSEPDHPVPSPPPSMAGQPARHSPGPSAPRNQSTAPQQRNGFALVWAVVLSAIGAVGVAIVIIVVIAVATNRGAPEPPLTTVDAECLTVAATVEPVSCDADGAQRVVAELSGRQSCPAGTATLISGPTTWCLGPVES